MRDDFGEVRSITYDIKEYTFLAHWNPENHRHFVFQDGIYSASWTIGVRRQYLGVPPHWRDVSYDTEFSWKIGDTTIVPPDKANHGSLGYAFNNNIYTQRHVPDDPYDLSTSGIFYVNNLKPEINEGHWLALINSLLVGSIEAGDDLGYIGVKWPSLLQDTTPDTWSIRVAFGHAPSVPEPSELAGSILAIGIAVLLRRHRKRS